MMNTYGPGMSGAGRRRVRVEVVLIACLCLGLLGVWVSESVRERREDCNRLGKSRNINQKLMKMIGSDSGRFSWKKRKGSKVEVKGLEKRRATKMLDRKLRKKQKAAKDKLPEDDDSDSEKESRAKKKKRTSKPKSTEFIPLRKFRATKPKPRQFVDGMTMDEKMAALEKADFPGFENIGSLTNV
mmetsp:Transcript_11378/g.20869  ORF Transcript_11378/g.20869 Transcript_11378/m.20869 type:complete len:185 (-) Transcript_11378:61-615(-)|eukprot:CAMPEP_0197536282 /NCGR_PEP_ID=MMETSP1318-20131121/53449_1 /TAXON_ID=552666 /ORGANISM="Partenskyella glossopodia, Strain RCC365" /LENGTH=184 /DNA_ID=CAMNT_0043094131 /DNA_START=78 /DNA_END=632 /DNA_ORIENTATION=-